MRHSGLTTTHRLLGGAVVALLAASCSGDGPRPPAEPAFASTEAHVLLHEELTINALFVADEEDPIWTQLSGVELVEGLEVSRHDIVVGDRTEWGTLGNLMVTVVPPDSAVTATEITVFLTDGTSAQFPIGAWTVEEAERPDGRVLEVREYIAAYPGTDMIEITAANVSGEPVEVRELDLGLTSLTVEEETLNGSTREGAEGVIVAPGATVTFSLRLTDHGAHDLYMTSPSVTVLGADGVPQVELFDPTLLGFTTITDDDVAAFAARATGRDTT